MLQAGLANKRTMQEVQVLKYAFKLLVYRAAGICEAKEARLRKCYVMAYKASKGDTASIPPEVRAHGFANILVRAKRYVEREEKAANDQLSPRALAVWADAEFINDAMIPQLHPCTRQVGCSQMPHHAHPFVLEACPADLLCSVLCASLLMHSSTVLAVCKIRTLTARKPDRTLTMTLADPANLH